MVLTLNNTNTFTANEIIVNATNLADLYATINYVNTNSNGVSQTDFDSEVATLRDKDITCNSALLSHISLIDTHTADIITNATINIKYKTAAKFSQHHFNNTPIKH